jgi:multimeric flavodoxin WrbA
MSTLIINCSYRPNGTAAQLCRLEQARFMTGFDEPSIYFLPDVKACHDCDKKPCNEGVGKCCLPQSIEVARFVDLVLKHDNIVFVVPVYLNAPTPKIMAMLTRISSYNDVAGRDLFSKQHAFITAVADVSGTQQTISIMTSALNLMGFAFPSKGNREHVLEWKTGKVRGGNLKTLVYYLDDRAKGGNE